MRSEQDPPSPSPPSSSSSSTSTIVGAAVAGGIMVIIGVSIIFVILHRRHRDIGEPTIRTQSMFASKDPGSLLKNPVWGGPSSTSLNGKVSRGTVERMQEKQGSQSVADSLMQLQPISSVTAPLYEPVQYSASINDKVS